MPARPELDLLPRNLRWRRYSNHTASFPTAPTDDPTRSHAGEQQLLELLLNLDKLKGAAEGGDDGARGGTGDAREGHERTKSAAIQSGDANAEAVLGVDIDGEGDGLNNTDSD